MVSKGPFPLITDQARFEQLVIDLEGAKILALDTEASSMHRYHTRVCLVQLSTDQGTWLLDPQELDDLAPLGKLVTDPAQELILHDADFDLRLLHDECGFRAAKVFDTMLASQLLGEPELGLASLLYKYLNVKLDKRFQKADWSQRPLPQEMQDYAAMDTHHLIALRDALAGRLQYKGRMHWAEEEFKLLPDIPFQVKTKDPSWLRIKWAKTLKGQQLSILKEMHDWREKEAQHRDRAPFMVLGNQSLIDIAKAPPDTLKELIAMKGIGERTVERYGTAIMKRLNKALKIPKEEWPKLEKPKRYPRDPEFDERVKRMKTARDKRAKELEIDAGVFFPNALLASCARSLPQNADELKALEGVRNWQVENIAEPLLRALH